MKKTELGFQRFQMRSHLLRLFKTTLLVWLIHLAGPLPRGLAAAPRLLKSCDVRNFFPHWPRSCADFRCPHMGVQSLPLSLNFHSSALGQILQLASIQHVREHWPDGVLQDLARPQVPTGSLGLEVVEAEMLVNIWGNTCGYRAWIKVPVFHELKGLGEQYESLFFTPDLKGTLSDPLRPSFFVPRVSMKPSRH